MTTEYSEVMAERVFAAGLINADERGDLCLRHRLTPYEDLDPLAEVEPPPRRIRRDFRYVRVTDPDSLLPTVPIRAGVYGSVGAEALAGRERPCIVIDQVVDFPTENRDGWDELVAASGSHLVVEGSPDFIRPGPSRLLSGKFPFETADIDIAEATSTTIIDSPLWNDLTSIGAGHVPGKGFANHIGVDIVTDEMRNWLLLSPGLVYVQPIVQRPARLRYRQAVRAITIG